jgi:heme exporter protein D
VTVGEFFHMGGYAFYVWTSYALALVVLVANVVEPLQRKRRLMSDLARRARRERSKV